MAKDITKTFIKQRHEVDDPDATAVHKPGQAKRDSLFDIGRSNVFLIGPRGSGKSTLARHLADRLEAVFQDTDDMVVQAVGESIAEYVGRYGWASFREREREQLQEVCRHRGQVVATGGGLVLQPENRQLMKECGSVFYLMPDVETLLQRLAAEEDKGRPALFEESLSLREEISRVLQEREPLYFEALHYMLQAGKPIEELLDDVLTMLGAASEG
jgi:shikimate kinase